MVLYEYPSEREKLDKRREFALMAAKRRKLKQRNILTYVSAALIVVIGVTADSAAAKIAICLLGCAIAVLCFITSAFMAAELGREHTVVSDEGFTHDTTGLFKGKKHFEIVFSEIEHTEQSPFGALVIRLKSGETETVPFKAANTKLFLIKNMSEQLKYPVKEYNVIEDDEPERKDWVDRL